MKDVDNSGKFDSVKEDQGNISRLETHTMQPTGVTNRGHLV
jgi:hypothetical protein